MKSLSFNEQNMYHHSCRSLYWFSLGWEDFLPLTSAHQNLEATSEEFSGPRTVQSFYVKGHRGRNDSVWAGTSQCGQIVFTCFVVCFLVSEAYFLFCCTTVRTSSRMCLETVFAMVLSGCLQCVSGSKVVTVSVMLTFSLSCCCAMVCTYILRKLKNLGMILARCIFWTGTLSRSRVFPEI